MSKELDYILGFAYGDGNLYKVPNLEKYRLALYQSESEILEKISHHLSNNFRGQFPVRSRSRSNEFSKEFTEYSIRTSSHEVCRFFMDRGLPVGKKSDILSKPSIYNELDFIRGYVDADGSLGLTGKGFPFLSIVISSTPFKEWICEKILEITGLKPNPSRNSRDNVYNVCIYKESAQAFAKALYEGSTISISRKFEKYLEVASWSRPESMRKLGQVKAWSEEEDSIVLSDILSTEEKLQLLGRSLSSYRNRRFRLLNP